MNMKQTLLIMVLALGMYSIKGSAQEKKYQVEDDGFEWYELSKYSDGHFCHGAQDKFGNTIIPLQEITIWYKNGYFRINPSGAGFSEKNGLVDKDGHLIVPMEYCDAAFFKGKGDKEYHLGIECDLPYIAVTGEGTFGIYNIYGKCLIPISRKYAYVSPQGKDESLYWECVHTISSPQKSSLCDASGKEFFSTTSKRYALLVNDESGWLFLDKNENVLLAASWGINLSKWPIKIKTKANEPMRNLTPAEQNKVFFSADWLDGNTEYFAHAAEYPMYKIGQNGLASGGGINQQQAGQQQQQSGGTTTIVVEHHHDPIPVQEWQQCPACYGSGQCPYVQCGGSGWYYIGDRARTCSMCHGSGKCSTCAGKGGHYVTVYR